jgi:hypothetical protein
MRNLVFGIVLGSAYSLALVAVAANQQYSEREALNRTRAPVPIATDPTVITVSDTSTGNSTAFSKNVILEIVCTIDSYYEWGTTSPTATSTSHYLPANTIIYRATDDTVLFVDFLRVGSTNGTCFVQELA